MPSARLVNRLGFNYGKINATEDSFGCVGVGFEGLCAA
jgi:hypothetical protein